MDATQLPYVQNDVALLEKEMRAFTARHKSKQIQWHLRMKQLADCKPVVRTATELKKFLVDVENLTAAFASDADSSRDDFENHTLAMRRHQEVNEVLELPSVLKFWASNGFYEEALLLLTHFEAIPDFTRKGGGKPTPTLLMALVSDDVYRFAIELRDQLMSAFHQNSQQMMTAFRLVSKVRQLDSCILQGSFRFDSDFANMAVLGTPALDINVISDYLDLNSHRTGTATAYEEDLRHDDAESNPWENFVAATVESIQHAHGVFGLDVRESLSGDRYHQQRLLATVLLPWFCRKKRDLEIDLFGRLCRTSKFGSLHSLLHSSMLCCTSLSHANGYFAPSLVATFETILRCFYSHLDHQMSQRISTLELNPAASSSFKPPENISAYVLLVNLHFFMLRAD